ncbi:glycoside hydrolase superfamily [Powellomyces hirtus]|nr:glycoside hydrolase superfamily [Powellomyces hirtus]
MQVVAMFHSISSILLLVSAGLVANAGQGTAHKAVIPLAFTPPLRTVGQDFVDAENRTVILRGMNVAGQSKLPNFRPISSPVQLDPLVQFGANAVRLLFNWEAFEGEGAGVFNQEYLDYYKNVIKELHDRGIASIIDIHQDMYARWINGGCGDGFPEWTVPPTVKKATPSGGDTCKYWAITQFFDRAYYNAWNEFWKDTYGARSGFLNMYARLIEETADLKGVIGYDVMNEPHGDEREHLVPLYRDAAAIIHKVNPDMLVFVEPTMLSGSGYGNTKLDGTGLRDVKNLVYAPHYYDAMALIGYWGKPIKFSPTPVIKKFREQSKKWGPIISGTTPSGVPIILGEFGAREINSAKYIQAFYDGLDETFTSSMQWVYEPNWTHETKDGWNMEDLSIVDGSLQLRSNFIPRPYAQSIAGVPTKLSFDASSIQFEWTQQEDSTAETVLYIPPASTVVNVTSTRDVDVVCTTKGRVRCRATRGGNAGIVISIKATEKTHANHHHHNLVDLFSGEVGEDAGNLHVQH